MDQIAEEKHRIAMMVELVLYKRLKAFDDDDNLDEKTREEQKREIVDAFVKKCSKTDILTQDQVREYVEFVLDRTIKNRNDLGR